MSEKPTRLRGFLDYLGDEVLKKDQIIFESFQIANQFQFQKVETPILESSEIFTKSLGAVSDIVNKEMYTFQKGDEHITLRPEGTASVARLFITEKLQKKIPLKLFYSGPMFRHERPQKGRFRQFSTFAIEMIGDSKIETDVEAIFLAELIFKKLEIIDSIHLEINYIGETEDRKKYIQDLKIYLEKYYSDLSKDSQIRFDKNPLRILDSKDETDQKILKEVPLLINNLNKNSIDKYNQIKEKLSLLNVSFVENPFLVRGLDYYNGLVFEFKSSKLGAQSAVLSGGRYDKLIEILGGESTPAMGWGAGLERIALLYEKEIQKYPIDIGLVVLGEKAKEKGFVLANQLREKAYSVFYHFTGNISKQMKRLDEKNVSFAIIFGDEELKAEVFSIKNLKNKEQIKIKNSNLIPYLKEEIK